MTTLYDIAKYAQDKLNDNRTTLGLDRNAIQYGDVTRLTVTPMVCIETGDKSRELNGAPRRTMVTGTVYLLVYHSAVKNASVNREADDQYAEQLETLMHEDASFGGLVIDSLVSAIEFGYQVRANTVYRASRLTLQARWQEMLP